MQVCTFGICPGLVQARLEAARAGGQVTPVSPSGGGGASTALWAACSSGRVVVCGIDYLDRLKGVACKLLAWEALLHDYPKYRTGHVLVQV